MRDKVKGLGNKEANSCCTEICSVNDSTLQCIFIRYNSEFEGLEDVNRNIKNRKCQCSFCLRLLGETGSAFD